MDPSSLHNPSLWLQTAVFVVGCVGVGMTSWKGAIGVSHRVRELKSELERMASAIEKQNGYVRSHGEQLSALRERLSVEESLTARDREIKQRPT